MALVEANALPTRELYKLLWAYYQGNGVYETLAEDIASVSLAKVAELRAIRNPANRAVEFYATKVWPGELDKALPIETDNDAIVEPLRQVWDWSNWAARKQRFMRWFASLGEGFVKVVATTDQTRIHFQVLDPAWVSDFDIDERGFLTWLRMDYATSRRRASGAQENYVHTEVWSKELQNARQWQHKKGLDVPLGQLGDPASSWEFSAADIDFIPIVYEPFRDVGGDLERGNGCFTHALDKIDEANRLASTLHSRLFRYGKPDKALVGMGTDPSGRPLPPPIVSRDEGTKSPDNDAYEVDGERLWRLPSGWKIESLVPNVAWDSALNILKDYLLELEHELPELVYWRINEAGDLSGKAIRLMLSGAIDRALEARGNAEAALVRADNMALTIGRNLGVFDSSVGDFDSGDFDHKFAPRDVIPMTEGEVADTMRIYVEASVPPTVAAKWAGKSAEAVTELEEATAAERRRQEVSLGGALERASAALARGGNEPEDAAVEEEPVEE